MPPRKVCRETDVPEAAIPPARIPAAPAESVPLLEMPPVKVVVSHAGIEREFATPGKVTGHALTSQDVVIMESAGGGGFGNPLARDPERVREDVLAGHVSAERAHDGYGVVFTPDGDVDVEATKRRRAELTAMRPRLAVRADERDAYEGGRGKHRVQRLAPGLASRLGIAEGDLVEMLGRHPAPLRAWVRIDGDTADDEVPLDSLARRILGIEPGATVELRRLSSPTAPPGLVS